MRALLEAARDATGAEFRPFTEPLGLERLDLLLGLMTLRAKHLDRERAYADIISRLA